MELKEIPDLKTAVILVGGKSTRMGTDKFLLEFHKKPQWKFMHDELQKFFDTVYISCRVDQTKHFYDCKLVIDQIEEIGPMGAIYSAFRQIKNSDNVFFVGCDLPHFKVEIAQKLYAQMDVGIDVCSAQSPDKEYPEPLVAIWNRRVLPILESRIENGDYALFKCMRKLNTQTVNISSNLLTNMNRQEDLKNDG